MVLIEYNLFLKGLDPTAEALKRCENWVLRPYRFVLIFVSDQYPISVVRLDLYVIVAWMDKLL